VAIDFKNALKAVSCVCVVSCGVTVEDSDILEAFRPDEARGEKTIKYQSPQGILERCVVTKTFPGVKYDKDDAKDTNELCGFSFYKKPLETAEGEAVALCPKMSSTFPGVEVYELGDYSKEKYETSLCKNQDKRPTKRAAKFKQSVSCSYTGSILGYYHLSRILGDAADVPAAVIRTMDVAEHKKIAERGVAWSTGLNNQLWKQVLGYDNNPKTRNNYFTPDLKQVYGVLSVNPTGEFRYSEINKNHADGATAKKMFLTTNEVKRVLNPSSVGTFVARDFASAAPVLQQMRDMSDLMLMDYLFQQQDRFGNIHAREFYYYLDEKGNVENKRLKRDDAGNIKTEKPTADAVVVKKLILKDNDCGSRPGNPKAFHLDEIKSIRHMSPRTYKGLRYLAQEWQAGRAHTFFQKEALLKTDDVFGIEGIDGFGKRLQTVSETLKAQCDAGKLLLDLDIEDHLKSKNSAADVKALCSSILKPSEPPVVKNICESSAHSITPYSYAVTEENKLVVRGDGGFMMELSATNKNNTPAKLGGRDVELMYDARSGVGTENEKRLFVYKLISNGNIYLKHDGSGDGIPMTCQ